MDKDSNSNPSQRIKDAAYSALEISAAFRAVFFNAEGVFTPAAITVLSFLADTADVRRTRELCDSKLGFMRLASGELDINTLLLLEGKRSLFWDIIHHLSVDDKSLLALLATLEKRGT